MEKSGDVADLGPWHRRWVRVGAIRTHYVEAGDGEPVVLVHGAGPGASGAHGWPEMIPALAEHFRVLAIDMLGFGYTDKPAGLMYSHQDQVDHLAGFIDTLCLGRVKLVGNSWGAYVAIKYALDHPENVQKVFTIGSGTVGQAMGLEQPDGLPARRALREYDGTEEKLRAFLEGILLHPPSDELVRSRNALANLPGAAEARRAMAAYSRRLRDDPNLRQRFMIRDRLPKVTIPMRMVWGKEDRFAPVAMAYELQQLLPNIPIEILENAGHQCQNDAPEEVNRRVLDFFRS